MSAIRAAKDWGGLRPTSVIMGDPFFGHRSFFTGDLLRDPDSWTEWDYLLITAFQIIEDNTLDNGVLRWVAESERVEIVADVKVDKFEAAIEAKTSGKNYKPRRGERYVPRVHLLGGEMPTYSEYIKLAMEEAGTIVG